MPANLLNYLCQTWVLWCTVYGMIVYCLVTLGAGAASQPARQLRGGRRVAPPARAPRAAPAR